jgi:hypothetical protein
MTGNLSVESMAVKNSSETGDANELPAFDFNPEETESEYLARNLSAADGFMTSVLSWFSQVTVTGTEPEFFSASTTEPVTDDCLTGAENETLITGTVFIPLSRNPELNPSTFTELGLNETFPGTGSSSPFGLQAVTERAITRQINNSGIRINPKAQRTNLPVDASFVFLKRIFVL